MENNNKKANTQLGEEKIERIRKELYDPLKEKDCILQGRKYSSGSSRAREEYQRDYTRILYSSAFRRLQGKMQMLAMDGTNFIRNRLTHSLEVAQIARSIANDIGYEPNELYVVEACSLAHDMGNPPFGHYGEKVLNDIIRNKCNDIKTNNSEKGPFCKVEGFEGNAQTLRILTTLSSKTTEYKGLNLTYRTLLGVIKYFRPFCKDGSKNKKYIYRNDFEDFDKFCRDNDISRRTLDVQIMDISDEIAYAAHDIEDSLKNRKFTIEEFLHEFKANEELKKEFGYDDFKHAVNVIENELIAKAREKVDKETTQYNDLFCKELGSIIIYTLIRDIDIVEKEGNKELGFKKLGALAAGLKKVTFECVNRSNEVRYYELKGEIILNDLFDYFYEKPQFLPKEYEKMIDDNKVTKIRPVIDYIAGMMDEYAIYLHKQIYGENRFKTYGFMEKKS